MLRDSKKEIYSHTPFFFVADYLEGIIKVNEYITHEYKFADINKGFDAMHVRPALLSENKFGLPDSIL
jgi:hypothetical protein